MKRMINKNLGIRNVAVTVAYIGFNLHHLRSIKKFYSTNGKGSESLFPLIYNFLVALFNNKLNLKSYKLKTYKQIILFLEGYKNGKLIKELNIDTDFLKMIKNKGKEFNSIPWSQERQDFCDYVKQTFPDFKVDEFLILEAAASPTSTPKKVQTINEGAFEGKTSNPVAASHKREERNETF